MDRKAARFDFHGHQARIALALDRADLADVDAGDAHRRFRADVDRRRELRLQAEAVFERDVLGEAEVHRDRHDHDEHDPGPHRVRPLQLDDRPILATPPARGSFALPLGLALGFGLGLRLGDPEGLERRGRVLVVEQVGFAAGYFAVVRDVARRRVADHGLARHVGLVGRFAQLRLAGAGHVRVGVEVQMVVVDDHRAALGRSFDRGAVGGRRGRVALVVDTGRGEHGVRACERPHADVLRLQARQVAERQRPVVAVGLLGRDPGEQRVADFERLREVFERKRDHWVVREFRERLRGFGQARVQGGGGGQVDGAYGEGVSQLRRDGAQRARAGAQQVHELGRVFIEGRLVRQRVDRLFQRRRPAPVRRFQRRRDARPGREEGVEIAEEFGVRFRDRRRLRGHPVERDEQLAQARGGLGQVVAARGSRSSRAGAVRGSCCSGRARGRRGRRRSCWC